MSAAPRGAFPNAQFSEHDRIATAVVYCEANFGAIDGKTANGLVRHSEKYKILSVIDSEKAGLDTGMVLDEKPNAIPIYRDLADAWRTPSVYRTTSSTAWRPRVAGYRPVSVAPCSRRSDSG